MSSIQLVLPINVGYMLPENDSVFIFKSVLDDLSMYPFYLLRGNIGRTPYPPRILAQITLFGHMVGITSGRAIEKACLYDLRFKWLLEGYNVPDHSTINRFMSDDNLEAFEALFYDFVKYLYTQNEIAFENVFIDGTKLEANANRYSFVWRKAVEKHLDKLLIKLKTSLYELVERFHFSETILKDALTPKLLTDILDALEKHRLNDRIEFVKGKGTRKTPLQRVYETLKEGLDKLLEYDRHLEIIGERNSYSKTDHDATFMRMKEDHMRNGQLKPGYNLQFAVEAEYVVGMSLTAHRSDQLALIPLLNKMTDVLETKYKRVIADAGYESEENYTYLFENSYEVYVKPTVYEQMKKKSFKKLIGRRENMRYDKEADTYYCHENRPLVFERVKTRKSQTGFISQLKIYTCESCEGCPVKARCTKSSGDKSIEVSHKLIEYRDKSYTNITSELGIQLRVNRSIQAEGAFSVLKESMGLRRLRRRSAKNALVECLMYAFAMNVNKLISKTTRNKLGQMLHELKAA